MSIPMKCLLVFLAAIAVVPLPTNGSRILAPSTVAQTLLAILTGERQPDGTVTLELPVYTMGDKQG